ncbi:MAG TPA: (E)-4-hydroxy-3-methylbut-2-enyl-diphosphate synthase [Caldisericia bacterium]|jgi:(E)-4-hydroxy-3-methylbut-2-enyl-diphosphate synthase|nr:(E)-4-hydroxy-3-methylbut-2-enyl-diphosphate synthase [Caldisericia bacterium]HXK51877.1 (E)-4-hydroxy-3-methylbut-2-enyl-diphosphate synthase [Caldisericia bacterium]
MSKKNIIHIGDIVIGGDHPIAIQSMLSCHPAQKKLVLQQLKELEEVGCQIIRVAFPDFEAVDSIPFLLSNTTLPIVADVHFHPQIAIECIKKGVHKLRLNPSNVKRKEDIRKIVSTAKEYEIPIRVGVNGGSIRNIYDEEEMIGEIQKLIRKEVQLLEEEDFHQIVLSVKTSEIRLNYLMNAWLYDNFLYPIHIGVTEAGPLIPGIIQTTIGLSPLLERRIGNTIRVSLTGELRNEVLAARYLLQSFGLYGGVRITSCPTCGRCKWNLRQYVQRLEKDTIHLKKSIHIAMMGCEVNGPGEAASADIGMAGSGKKAVLFKSGKIQKTGTTEEIYQLLLSEILRYSSD